MSIIASNFQTDLPLFFIFKSAGNSVHGGKTSAAAPFHQLAINIFESCLPAVIGRVILWEACPPFLCAESEDSAHEKSRPRRSHPGLSPTHLTGRRTVGLQRGKKSPRFSSDQARKPPSPCVGRKKEMSPVLFSATGTVSVSGPALPSPPLPFLRNRTKVIPDRARDPSENPIHRQPRHR